MLLTSRIRPLPVCSKSCFRPVGGSIATRSAAPSHLAERLDGELDDDEFNYMNPRAIDRSTVPDMPLTATLDGGYVHSSDQKSRRDGWFQAVCGTVTSHDGTTRRFGFVPGADATPRSRIRAVLDA